MLPELLQDDWKDWKTCTDDNFYVRFGLEPEKAVSYTTEQIEAAFRQRRDWWAKKPASHTDWGERRRLAEGSLVEARKTLIDNQKKKNYDQKLEEEQRQKGKKEYENQINHFKKFSVYPPLKDKILTPEEEENISHAGREIGLSEAECKKIIDEALKLKGAMREESTKDSGSSIEVFKHSVYGMILDGYLEPNETRHLLELAMKCNIPEDEARKKIDECLKEKGAKRGKPNVSNLPPEMVDKNYYEILGISERASDQEIEQSYKKQFNLWNSRASVTGFRDFASPAKNLLLEARNTLLDDNKRREYNQKLKEKDLKDEIIAPPPSIVVLPILKVNELNLSFKNVSIGSCQSKTIEINNAGGGILTGTIKTNAKWLKVSQNKIDRSQRRQNITITVDASDQKLGFRDSGIVEIQSNAGTVRIDVDFSIETPTERVDKLTKISTGITSVICGIYSFYLLNSVSGRAFLGLLSVITIYIIGLFQVKANNKNIGYFLICVGGCILFINNGKIFFSLLSIPITWWISKPIFRYYPLKKYLAGVIPISVCLFSILGYGFISGNIPNYLNANRGENNQILPSNQEGIVTVSQVNIRSLPSSTSEVITNASEGDKFPVLSEEGDWYRIQMADNSTGYIHKSLLSLGEEKHIDTSEKKYSSENSIPEPEVKKANIVEEVATPKAEEENSEKREQIEVTQKTSKKETSNPEPAIPNTSVANIVESGKVTKDKEAFPIAKEESNKPKYATIIIDSEPLGSQIYLDNELIGNTPLSKSIPVGGHIIVVKKSGYRDWPYKVTLSADEKKSIKATLSAN